MMAGTALSQQDRAVARDAGQAPIFVVGMPRAGTTLTARVLGNHPRIFMPAETHFFDDIYSRRRRLGDPRDPEALARIAGRLATLYKRQHEGGFQKRLSGILTEPGRLVAKLKACTSYGDVLSRFMALQMAETGKVRWGNQVPRDIFNMADILALYPDAKVVACVRDVRDFLLSYSQMKDAARPHHARRHRHLYHPVVTSLLWRATARHVELLRRQVPTGNLKIVRYEDLVRQPEQEITEVCAMLGEAFDPAMLAVRANNSSDVSTRSGGAGIFDSSVGRWRAALPLEDAWIGQKIAGRHLRALGYQAESLAANPAKLAYIAATGPFALLRGLYANRAKQGALAPYLAKRAASLFRP